MERILDKTTGWIQYNVNENVFEEGIFVGLFQRIIGRFKELDFQEQPGHAIYASMIYLLSHLFIIKYNHH